MSVDHETWTAEHDYPHPPGRVFAAWSRPEVKLRWFDLSDHPDPDYLLDFRVGGIEVYRTPIDRPPVAVYQARYLDIVAEERLVYSYEIVVDGRRASVSLGTVEFVARPSGTRLRYTEQGAYLDGLDSAAARRGGLDTQLRVLATVLDAGT